VVTSFAETRLLPGERLDALFAALGADGRQVIGPTVVDGAIVLGELASVDDLPVGLGLETAPGRARIVDRGDRRRFSYAVGPTSLKPLVFPPRVEALAFEVRPDGSPGIRLAVPERRPVAVLGARACDLAALACQDHVLRDGPAVDPDYAARRSDLLVVAVECAVADDTCFCASMGTGPEVTGGADLVLHELDSGFTIRSGSPAGSRILDRLDLAPASPAEIDAAGVQVRAARTMQTHGVMADGLAERLLCALDHPRWDDVAARCVACGSCTLVCPTCFCTGLVVGSDLDGGKASATRTWDSCFTEGFGQVAGGSFRPRHRDRYRQWLTHKFATWWQQFGSSGCVGCGRCVAWCPVGIDVRDELAALAPARPAEAAAAAPPVAGPVDTPALPPPAARRHLPGPESIPLDFARATVVETRPETADTVTLRLSTDSPALLAGRPGQFVMAALPGFSMPPLSVSRFHADGLELTIRAAGAATTALTRLSRGEVVALRGPLGHGWPVDDARGRDVVVVAGGIGLAPLRPVIDALLAERDAFADIRLYLGARTPRDRLFVSEVQALAGRADLLVRETVDRAGADWFGRVGIVTQLFRTVHGTGTDATAFVCGPERMMLATAEVLEDLAVPRSHLWLSLERRMECGVGLCGHCQAAGRFVCRNGPVLSMAELGDELWREGW
jgi:sulfhydrogenase subunit beta (sulfur reductase)